MNIVYVKKKRRLYDYIFLTGTQSSGEFGNNYISSVAEPYPYLDNNSWKQIETNYYYSTLAIDNNSNLWGWGANTHGILQNEDLNILEQYPVLIDSGENWSSISMGENHCMAIKSNGTLWGIGSNTKAQLGIYENELQKTPLDINVSGIAQIVSSDNGSSFFIKTDGTLWAWGYNVNAQLGLGDTTQRTSPVQVGTDTNWASVSGGTLYTLAVKTNGTLWAWGNNSYGNLGLGDTTQRTSPVQVGTDTNWESVSCGNYHTLAFKTNGTLWAWGSNSSGQLGLGDKTQRTSPVQVGTDTNWKFFTVTNSGSHVIKNTY